MLFNSYIFILFFLPICIAGYFLLNHSRRQKSAQLFLLLMSLWFYGFFHLNYLLIILVSIVVNYVVYRAMLRMPGKRILLIGALSFNLGLLFYFKYYDFFLENINFVFRKDFALKNILLPLGISFFTFQQISFVIDAYKGEAPGYGFLHYASFVTFFPQLIAGPIVTHDELIPQFEDPERKRFNWDNFSRGIYIFVLGLGKKVLLADTFGNAVNWGFDNIGQLDTANALIVMFSYTFQIYFDFSGYCDMAVGIGRMLNIDLPLNFDSPYKAFTIDEFWRRWHMTLTRFFTKYIYIPLGGNRKGKARTYFNTLVVFFVSGLWHGANWTFVLWGMMHGIFVVVSRHWNSFFKKLHPALNWMITFLFVNAAWLFFRADSVRDALRILYRISLLRFEEVHPDLEACFNLVEFRWLFDKVICFDPFEARPFLLGAVFMAIAFASVLGSRNSYEKMVSFKPTAGRLFCISLLLVWCIFSFSGISTFLYFNF